MHTDDSLYRIECSGGRVTSISLSSESHGCLEDAPGPLIDAKGSLILPSYVLPSHPWPQIRSCGQTMPLSYSSRQGFILDRCELMTGDFAEALKVTNQAKAAFSREDLYMRGQKLIRDSIECGVTSMRAHVEVDTTVELSCLTVGLELHKALRNLCDIQIAAFAQEPLFDAPDTSEPGRNFSLLVQAAETPGINVIGSAPYVEPTLQQAKANIALVLKLAQKHACHVDFHLDYNLDPGSEPLIYEVISQAKLLSWSNSLRITIGHATRMQLFTTAQWGELVTAIDELPIIFVGLPQSDMYMLGREGTGTLLGPPRSTLRIPYIANKYGLEVAMSVNNAQNAFTPQGSVDPLSLCTLGVALFQSATAKDITTLLRSVTLTSKRAIGHTDVPGDLCISVNDPADFVLLRGTIDLQSAVLNPSYDRTVIRRGVVVARRHSAKWFADMGSGQ